MKIFDYKPYILSLVKFMVKHNFTKRPLPKVVLNNEKQEGVFIKTGHYEIDENRVVLFINGRHPKDVLRSLAHELIHHKQYIDGRLLSDEIGDDTHITSNKKIIRFEEEAFLKGNMAFRSWTEQYK